MSYETEKDSPQDRFVLVVKRAIQEYVSIEVGVNRTYVYPFGGDGSSSKESRARIRPSSP